MRKQEEAASFCLFSSKQGTASNKKHCSDLAKALDEAKKTILDLNSKIGEETCNQHSQGGKDEYK